MKKKMRPCIEGGERRKDPERVRKPKVNVLESEMIIMRWFITPNTFRFLIGKIGPAKEVANLVGVSRTRLYEYARGRPIVDEGIAQSIESILKQYNFSDSFPYKGIYEDKKEVS